MEPSSSSYFILFWQWKNILLATVIFKYLINLEIYIFYLLKQLWLLIPKTLLKILSYTIQELCCHSFNCRLPLPSNPCLGGVPSPTLLGDRLTTTRTNEPKNPLSVYQNILMGTSHYSWQFHLCTELSMYYVLLSSYVTIPKRKINVNLVKMCRKWKDRNQKWKYSPRIISFSQTNKRIQRAYFYWD